MNNTLAPVLFLSHGSPMRVLESSPANTFLKSLAGRIATPKAIVVVSPHWETTGLHFTQQAQLETIYDFWGFPNALNQIKYLPDSPEWLHQTLKRSLPHVAGTKRGLDHGAWSLLHLMYPKQNVPVVGLSLPRDASLAELYALGEQLAALRAQGIMLVTSGMATHNLAALAYQGEPYSWALAFVEWLQHAVEQCNIQALLNYRQLAPGAQQSHPRDEHLRPLFVALGAAGAQPAKLIHDSWELKNGNNSSWLWGELNE
ncbi:dioxygenase [Agarivorans sp. Toyoura001]|uniref:DODA-type extradiol aromatic ring-opening family dioxygenase n=1 Tax=Agarivorans sp. Toyoura001 TaxID=2283141 RepID=UPI0010CF0CE1|nr:class III extradiol ring-cleavage dioxygenase [Agarivorans sp. Toyoura001]GDY24459.1 dioxygenase [Agarivorans sp. Toyoura001]